MEKVNAAECKTLKAMKSTSKVWTIYTKRPLPIPCEPQ